MHIIHILHLPPTLTTLGVDDIPHYGEQPSLEVRAGLEPASILERTHDCVLDQIIRPIPVSNEGPSEGTKLACCRKKASSENSLGCFCQAFSVNCHSPLSG